MKSKEKSQGFINLLKPPGMTSSDAVVAVRRILGEKRIGHAGTLDPEAAGVLPLAIGKATRLITMLAETGKTYWCELVVGSETDTCDAYGKTIAVSNSRVGEEELRRVLPAFIGEILQTPPVFSAIKHHGKRMYELARAGEAPEVPARRVFIESIELLEAHPPRFSLRVRCGGGTYIRALCRDLGRAMGSAAHMGMLVRETVGPMDIADSVTFEDMIGRIHEDTPFILPPLCAVAHLPEARVPENLHSKLLNGNPLPAAACGTEGVLGRCRVMLEGALAAVGECDGREIRISILLLERDS